jgi:hypothetical protein
MSEDLFGNNLCMGLRYFDMVLDGKEYSPHTKFTKDGEFVSTDSEYIPYGRSFTKKMLQAIKKTKTHRVLFKGIIIEPCDGAARPTNDYDLELTQ